MKKIDSDIQQDVARELAWDTRLSPTEIGIQVKDGIVTLTGAVVRERVRPSPAEPSARRPPPVSC